MEKVTITLLNGHTIYTEGEKDFIYKKMRELFRRCIIVEDSYNRTIIIPISSILKIEVKDSGRS